MVRIQRCLRQALPQLLGFAFAGVTACSAQQFLPDDPLARTPEVAAVRQTDVQDINAMYDFFHNSIHYKNQAATESLAINTLGEVPDSSWFTNRDISNLSIEAVKKGGRVHGGPQPPYTVVAAKTEGVSTGFRIRDARGLLYFVKGDPPSNLEMATAADVMGALFCYAAGYNVPENYILVGRTDEFRLSEKATMKSTYGKDRRLRAGELRQIFDRIPREPDGRIRLMASLSLPPKIMGPFRYAGVRSDDPNDLVPHQQRRDLRGLDVLFAWINHTDAKGENSLDTVEGAGEDVRFVHHLLDFGDSFGSDSDIAKDPRHGQEFWLPTSREQTNRAMTLGLVPTSWEKAKYPHQLPAAGNFTTTGFDPLTWKPNYPNPAFLEMTPQDAYWGAKRVMSFSNEDIRAIVEQGRFSNPAVTDYITQVLIARRDLVGKAWFSQVPPLEDFTIAGGRLHYTDLGQKYGVLPAEDYKFSWFSFDDDSGSPVIPANGSTEAVPPSLADGDLI